MIMNQQSELMATEGYYEWRSVNCTKCTNWWYFSTSDLLKQKPPKDFPFPKEKLDIQGRLVPFPLTFPGIELAIIYVHATPL
jgi:hypothetical protein